MIIKTFENDKLKKNNSVLNLMYGDNEGHKISLINRYFLMDFEGSVEKYDEKEVLNDPNKIIIGLLNKSFFDSKKIIIISRVSERILEFVKEIHGRDITGINIIFKAGILEKRSKLRNFFEKEKKATCIPFYQDDTKTLINIANNFFREHSIIVSQEIINILVEKSSGDRKNLENEFNKIKLYLGKNKKISLEEIISLVNLTENHSVYELIDSCLLKNEKKTAKILNENNYNIEDCILILRTFLSRTKRILSLRSSYEKSKDIDQVITSYKPTIFWKEKDIVKKQISSWDLNNLKKIIYNTNEVELLIKKNSENSLNIVYDFILSTCKSN